MRDVCESNTPVLPADHVTTPSVFGLGADIASFLAFYGAVFDGNILSLEPGYSIGGPSSLNQQILSGGGILGTPQGLSGSHNKCK